MDDYGFEVLFELDFFVEVYVLMVFGVVEVVVLLDFDLIGKFV